MENDSMPQNAERTNGQPPRAVKVTKISLNHPTANPELKQTIQPNNTVSWSTQPGRGTQLSSYINSQLGNQPRPLSSYQMKESNVIQSSQPGLAYSTNTYTNAYNNVARSPRANQTSGFLGYHSTSNFNKTSSHYFSSNGQRTSQVYRQSNMNLATSNNGKEIIKEVPIFLEKIIERPVIVEKTVEVEIERPVYVDKKIEVVRGPPITIEKIVEKPVYVSRPNPQMEKEIKGLRDHTATLESENARLKAENERERVIEINKETVTTITDQHELKAWENKVKDLEASKARLESAVKQLEHENIRLKYENDTLKNEVAPLNDLKEKNRDLSGEIHSLRQKLATINSINEERTTSDNKMARETQQLRQEISEIKNDYQKKVKDLEVVKSQLEESLKTSNAEATKLKESIKDKETGYNNVCDKIRAYEGQINQLKGDLERYTRDIEHLRSKNTQLSQDLEEAKQSVQSKLDNQHMSISELYKKQIDEYKKIFEEKQDELTAFQNKIENLERYIEDLEKDKSELQHLIMDLQDQNKELNGQVEELAAKEELVEENIEDDKSFEVDIDPLDDLRDKNVTIKEEYEHMMRESVVALEQQLEDAYNQISKKKNKNKSLKEKLMFNNFRLVATASELERLRSMVISG